ncbi:MAG: orotate phosphoribosyltransferase [Pseudomonadota bacterium]|nr:orotate phosphoribosyltransferase [Pseudomonadota bacterium]
MDSAIQRLIIELYDVGIIKFGKFTLKSGKQSYIYADVRTAISHPQIFRQICDLFYSLIKDLQFSHICGVPYSALTFASGVAYAHHIPMLLKRKEMKAYGTKKILEGEYKDGDICLLIEDVITSGSSLLETIAVLKEHGLVIKDICTLIDRNQGGGSEALNKLGYNVYSIMNLHDVINTLYNAGKISLADKELSEQLESV